MEPNTWEASPVWTEERVSVVGRGCQKEARECCEGTGIYQKCELQFNTESCGDPLKKRRGVAA